MGVHHNDLRGFVGLLLKSINFGIIRGFQLSHISEDESYKYNRPLSLHKRAPARSQNSSKSLRELTGYNNRQSLHL